MERRRDMNVRRMVAMGLILLLVLAWGACSEDKSPPESEKTVTSSDVKKEFGEAFQSLKDYTYEQREEYFRKANEELDQLDASIDALKKDIETKSDEMKKSLENRLEKLKERQSAAKERLRKMMGSSENAWKEMKEGMQQALDDLKKGYEDAMAELS